MAVERDDDEDYDVLIENCTFMGPLDIELIEGTTYCLSGCSFENNDRHTIKMIPRPVSEEELRQAEEKLAKIEAELDGTVSS